LTAIGTAYGNEQTASQLADYGPVACFTRPIDIESAARLALERLLVDPAWLSSITA
jgi:hypothetical protein